MPMPSCSSTTLRRCRLKLFAWTVTVTLGPKPNRHPFSEYCSERVTFIHDFSGRLKIAEVLAVFIVGKPGLAGIRGRIRDMLVCFGSPLRAGVGVARLARESALFPEDRGYCKQTRMSTFYAFPIATPTAFPLPEN